MDSGGRGSNGKGMDTERRTECEMARRMEREMECGMECGVGRAIQHAMPRRLPTSRSPHPDSGSRPKPPYAWTSLA